MGTPSLLRRTPEEERALLEELAAMRPQAAAPAIEPPPAPPEPDALDQLASMSRPDATQAPAATTGSYEAPPERGKDTWQKFLMMALDVGLNKGRGLGSIVSTADNVEYDNWMRRDKAKTSASQRDNRGADPLQIANRQRALELQERGIEAREKHAERLGDKDMRDNDPESDAANRERDFYYSMNVKPGSLDGLSSSQMRGNPAVKHLIDLGFAPQLNEAAADKARGAAEATAPSKVGVARDSAAATEAIRQPNRIELAEVGEGKRIAAEERAAGRTSGYRAQDFAERYSKDNENEIAIAGMIDGIDAGGGAVPDSVMERLRGVAAGYGIATPERMDAWQSKQMVVELWSRAQSGAAINMSEDDKFAIQTGLSPTASKEQIDSAYRVMSRVMQTKLGSKAAANPDAARSVLEGGGVNADRWLGKKPAPAAPRRPARPARPAEVDDDGLLNMIGRGRK